MHVITARSDIIRSAKTFNIAWMDIYIAFGNCKRTNCGCTIAMWESIPA